MGKEKKLVHWTDIAANNIIREKGDKKKYVLAAGITPSGIVHIGNFREIITVDLVKRALEKRGKEVRFIYSWDDYDVFRKVPKNMPEQDLLNKNLRKSIVDVPDTHGCHDSYAEHNEKAVEEEIKEVGVNPEFIYQAEKYRSSDYADDMKFVLENTEKIKEILNQHRENPLSEDWLPIALFCSRCFKDTISEIKWTSGYLVNYKCECGQEEEINFKKNPIVKLKWRVDWPMRWNYEQVDFEPGGKDHSTRGGSYDTGKEIIKELWGRDAPNYVMYDFINLKGSTGKMSSSKGNVITIKDVLKIYEPEIVRYLFAGPRPNKEFAISFDVDVLTIYEDFDKAERVYFNQEEIKEKKAEKLKAAYELSYMGELPETIPYQPKFRHLTMLLQINNFDIDKTIGYFEKELKNDHDKKRLRQRTQCAVNWVKKYAPEEFKFHVQEECQVTIVEAEKKILHQLAEKLTERDWTDVELHEEIYILCKNNEFPTGDFFKLAYRVLINKDKGPRLASFILEIGKNKVAELFKKV